MTHRRNYVLHINGQDYHVYGDVLPLGQQQVQITLRLTKRHGTLGPNYDGTWNSIQAAILYAQVRDAAVWHVWLHLYRARGQWVPGAVLSDLYGGEARRRVRDLRELGWPIELRPPNGNGRGVWDYRLALPRRRMVRVP